MSEPPAVIVHAVSAAENPTPLTATVAPTPPNVGFRVIEGLTTTVNAVDAASPPEPVTVIVYVPAETAPTTKLPLGWPLPGVTKLQVGVVTIGPPLIVHVVSVVSNEVPLTVTVIPVRPAFGVKTIPGVETVKVV
jgi:hypothetical protein